MRGTEEQHPMSENQQGGNTGGDTPPANQNGDQGSQGGQGGGREFKAITTQDDLNKVIDERLTRERAKYSDYDDLKGKAAELDRLAEASKSNEDKLNDRIAALEQNNAKANLDALRYRIAAKHQISDANAALYLTGTDEAALTAQAEGLVQMAANAKQNGNHVSREGRTPPGSNPSDEREFVRGLFGGGDS